MPPSGDRPCERARQKVGAKAGLSLFRAISLAPLNIAVMPFRRAFHGNKAAGMNDYLAKPVSRAAIVEALRRWISQP